MAFSFNSAGHAFATFFKAAAKDVVAVATDIKNVATEVEGTKTVVEATTAAILGVVDPSAVVPAAGIENAAYAVLGEIVALINAGGAAAAAKLVNAGLDQSVVTAAQAVASTASQIGTLVNAAK